MWWALLGLAWAVALAVDAAWGTVAFTVALRRAELDPDRLRVPAVASAALVVPMAVVVDPVAAVEVVISVNRSFLMAAVAPAAPVIAIAAAAAAAPATGMMFLMRIFDSFCWPRGPVVG